MIFMATNYFKNTNTVTKSSAVYTGSNQNSSQAPTLGNSLIRAVTGGTQTPTERLTSGGSSSSGSSNRSSGGGSSSSGGSSGAVYSGASQNSSQAPVAVIKTSEPVVVKPSASVSVGEGFWNNVSVGEIRASGYKNLDAWKTAYKNGQAPAPPSAIGNSFRIDSKSGRLIDTQTGAIKPNVKEDAEFQAIKDRTKRIRDINKFANEGGGKVTGTITDYDKALLKERNLEGKQSFYDPVTQTGGEIYGRINQGSLQSAPTMTQAIAITAQKVAETPTQSTYREGTYTSRTPISAIGISLFDKEYKVIENTSNGDAFVEVSPGAFLKKKDFEKTQSLSVGGQKFDYYDAQGNKLNNAEEIRNKIFKTGMKEASLSFVGGLNVGGGLAVKEAQAATRVGFNVLENIFGKQATKEVIKAEAKQAAKQTTKASTETIAEQFAKTFGTKTKNILSSKPIQIGTGMAKGYAITLGGNIIGQEAPGAFTSGSITTEEMTGNLDLTTKEKEDMENKFLPTAYEDYRKETYGYNEETKTEEGVQIKEVKGKASDLEQLITNVVPVARMFGSTKDSFRNSLRKQLKDEGWSDARINKNIDGLVRSYFDARQFGATIGNVAVEAAGELGFRKVAKTAFKTPNLTGTRSGFGYGLKLGAHSIPFGMAEGYSQDVIESKATYRQRDAGRELQSAIYGGAISSVFNVGTGTAMGFAGKKATQFLPNKPSAFKTGAELGGKAVTLAGYALDFPGEPAGDISADILEKMVSRSKNKVDVKVPRGAGVKGMGGTSKDMVVEKGDGKVSVQSGGFLNLFGFGTTQTGSKGGTIDLGGVGKGEGQGKGKGNGDPNPAKGGDSVLDLGGIGNPEPSGKDDTPAKDDTTVPGQGQAQAEDIVNVNVMTPVGGGFGFPFLPFGGSGQGTRRTRGTIRNELSEALSSMGLRTRQEVSVGKDYLKKFNRLRR